LEYRRKERILQNIQILQVFHVLLAFPQETSRYQRSNLLRFSGFQRRNQEAKEVQEHKIPSACRRTTVLLRPWTQIRVSVRLGVIYDCRITFPEGAIGNLIKY
jgi:hypothetical protein